MEVGGESPPGLPGGGFAAPLQYPQWDPAAKGTFIDREALPLPISRIGPQPALPQPQAPPNTAAGTLSGPYGSNPTVR